MTKPKLNPSLTTFDYIIEAIAGICLIYTIILVIVEYPGLLDKVPVHFDASGTPDDWGHKSTLLILPVVSIILYAGLTILNQFPSIFNYPFRITEDNAAKQYQLAKSMLIGLKTATVGMFAYIQFRTITLATGEPGGLGSFFIIAVMLVTMGPIIIYFISAYKNR